MNLNSAECADALFQAENYLQEKCPLAIVVSKATLQENLIISKRTKDGLKKFAASGRPILTILKDNVSVPPELRLGEWFDFRNENQFEESIFDVTGFLIQNSISSERAPSFGIRPAKERVLSNLFPVAELPKFVYSVKTHFKTESELIEACPEAGPLPFLVKNSHIYTIESPSPETSFAYVVSDWNMLKQENFM